MVEQLVDVRWPPRSMRRLSVSARDESVPHRKWWPRARRPPPLIEESVHRGRDQLVLAGVFAHRQEIE